MFHNKQNMKSMSDHYQKPHTLNDCKLTSFNKHEYLSISREKHLLLRGIKKENHIIKTL